MAVRLRITSIPLMFLLLCSALLATTLQGVQGEVEVEGPSESECRPYIEKALKKLETGDTQSADVQDDDITHIVTTDDSDTQSGEAIESIEPKSVEEGDGTQEDTGETESVEVETVKDQDDSEQTGDTQEVSAEDKTETEEETVQADQAEAASEEKEGETEEATDSAEKETSVEGEQEVSTEKEETEEQGTEEQKSAEEGEQTTEAASAEEGTEEAAASAEQQDEAAASAEEASASTEQQDETAASAEEVAASAEQEEAAGSVEEGEAGPSAEQEEGTASVEEGAASVEEGAASVEDGAASVENAATSAEQQDEETASAEEGDATTSTEQEEGAASVEEGAASVEDGAASVEDGAASVENGASSVEEGAASVEDGAASVEDGAASVEDGAASVEEATASTEEAAESAEQEKGAASTEEAAASAEEGAASTEEAAASAEQQDEAAASTEDAAAASTEDAAASVEEQAEASEEKSEGEPSAEQTDAASAEQEAAASTEQVDEAASVEKEASVEAEGEEKAESTEGEKEESGEKSEEKASAEGTEGESAEKEQADEASQEGAEEASEEAEKENTPEEDLTWEPEIPSELRPRGHINEIMNLNDEPSDTDNLILKAADKTLNELKKIYENAIKPLETVYKYRDLSNRHFGDPEIFSKPLVLFMGPWSGGKSSIVNYLLDNEYTPTALRTGAEPSPAYFNLLMWGEEPEVLDGTQLAADWTFSGLQKFGQGLEERLRGLKLPNKLLEKINIVEIPGILEVRKQVSRMFPFNDACQWFIDRADIIFLVYDPSKLDVGPETEAILDQLKGREYQTRIILNKADQVKPEELMRVQGALIWNISPLMSSAQPPVMYSTSLWSRPYESGSPARLLHAQERSFLKDLKTAVDKRIENKIASARRFAVRVRNHAKMVDCYLTTYYNHKSVFGNKKLVSDQIIEHPQDYHIYEGLSTLTNISRYDLPDPDVYRDFFRLNPLYDFQQLSATCTYFRGCPINRLDVAIAYDLPELVGKYKKMIEPATNNNADSSTKS